MRLFFAALICCAITAHSAGGEQALPYKAYINANDVYIRSGPGQSYYPTDKLKLGQEVEVYRHDPGGWYAIRPVEDGFSWVSAKYLQPQDGKLAVVAEENVACRVGSRFSDIRDVIQVRLHRGEVVELLDAQPSGPNLEAKGWYKIAPPSGEFRWVFGKYVDADYPHDGLRKTADSHGAAGRGTAAGADTAGSPAADAPVASAERRSRKARHGEALSWATARKPSGSTAIETEAEADEGEDASQASAPRTASPEEYQAALQAIDLELSTMVVEEPTVWTFDTLRQRTQLLLSQAETALERGRARWLLSRINRFADIKERYDALASLRADTERTSRQYASQSSRQSPADRSSDAAGRFDAVGRLVEVSSSKTAAPRFALLDESGHVRCYVSPAPGVNLRYYVGRQVAMNGTRGYMPEQRAQHLMARHVSLMDDRTLR